MSSFFFQFQGVDYFTWSDRHGVEHPLIPTNSSCNSKSPVWMSNKGEVTDIDQLPIKTISYGPLSFEQEQVKARTTRFRWTQLSKIPSSNPGRLLNSNIATQTHSNLVKL